MCRICEEYSKNILEEIDRGRLVIKRSKADLKKLEKGIKIKSKRK